MTPLLLTLLLHAAPGPPLVLAVGANTPQDRRQTPLSFADDDAAAAAELFGRPERSWLLTTMDADTQQRFPELRTRARAPTVDELKRAVADMARELARHPVDEAPDVLVWLVGHGAFNGEGDFYVALEDGELTTAALEEWVVHPLRAAHRIHILADACHAEALVKSRAAVLPAGPEEVQRQVFVQSQVRQGNVGFMVAAAAHQKTYEWSEIQSGVFSALVRSGLRGSANADGDDCVTYPELTSYVAASLRGVAVATARPSVKSAPPGVDHHAPLSCRAWFNHTRELKADLSGMGTVHVEDQRGVWLAGGRFERAHLTSLWLPESSRLTVRGASSEFPLVPGPDGTTWALADAVAPSSTAQRGALDVALREGLFAVAFGPAFAQGFEAAQTPPERTWTGDTPASTTRLHIPAWLALPPLGASLVLAGATLLGGGAATYFWAAFNSTTLQKPAEDALGNAQKFALVTAVAALGCTVMLLTGLAWLLADLLITLR